MRTAFMKRYERAFDRFCERTGFNPARWMPHIAVPDTIRQMGTSYSTEEVAAIREDPSELLGGTKVDLPFHSFYELAWVWTSTKNPDGRAQAFWGFLHEISLGVYTPEKYWTPVDVTTTKENLFDD